MLVKMLKRKEGMKLDSNENKDGREIWRTPMQTKVRVPIPITCKQSLSYSKMKYLQNKLGNKPANEIMG